MIGIPSSAIAGGVGDPNPTKYQKQQHLTKSSVSVPTLVERGYQSPVAREYFPLLQIPSGPPLYPVPRSGPFIRGPKAEVQRGDEEDPVQDGFVPRIR